MVDDDVAGLAGGFGAHDALGGDDLAGEGGLVLVHVDGDGGLVVVRLGFQEVLLHGEGGSEGKREGEGEKRRVGMSVVPNLKFQTARQTNVGSMRGPLCTWPSRLRS